MTMKKMTSPEPPFPCPFCHSSRVALIGGGLVFLHYKCTECAEVWTAMSAPHAAIRRPAYVLSTDADEDETIVVPGKVDDPTFKDGRRGNKFWRN